jgi:hypothetical protein
VFCRAQLGPGDRGEVEAEDIAARVWLDLWNPTSDLLRRFDPDRGCPFTTYLFGLAKNAIAHARRSRRRRRDRESHYGRLSAPDAGDSFVLMESQLDEFTGRLTPREREFFLTEMLGLQIQPPRVPFSPSNARKYRQLVTDKLNAFLDENKGRGRRDKVIPWFSRFGPRRAIT